MATLYANIKEIRFEVVVVDNASRDGCGEMLSREYKSAVFVESEENLGFARANNLGFQYCSGRNILFLNPDTEVIGSAIQEMVHFLDETQDAGIVGPMLLNPDGTIQTSCIRTFPSLVNEALDTDFLRERFPRSKLWGTKPLFEEGQAAVPVDAVSGASLMIKRQAFMETGFFTTAYFMYAEDTDLCFQGRQAGWITYFMPRSTVVHYGGQSTELRDDRHFSDVVLRESRLRFFRKRMGSPYAGAYRATTTLMSLIRLSLISFFWIVPVAPRKRATLDRSFRKWFRILRWSVGMERWARQLAN